MGGRILDRTGSWQHHVEQYLHGELTLREYCTRHELSRSTCVYWRRKLRQAALPVRRESPVNIVRVQLASSSGLMGEASEVVLHDGRCIRVPVDSDGATLQRLVVTLERVP